MPEEGYSQSRNGEDEVKKTLQIAIHDQETFGWMHLLIDDDAEAALVFLQVHFILTILTITYSGF